jgi:hypothetical protein
MTTAGKVLCCIKNISGNTCMNTTLWCEPNSVGTIDISSLSNGVYIISILTGNTYEHFRFVKIN